jgi:hypothetical protein
LTVANGINMGAVIHSVVRYGLSVPCFGVGVDAALLARWADVAETAGWDGFSSGITCSPSPQGWWTWSTRGLP